MGPRRTSRTSRALAAILSVVLASACEDVPALAQWGGSVAGGQFELADAVQLDQIDNTIRAQLDRVKTLLGDRQWDDAVEILCQLMEASEGRLIAVADRRYVGLRDWCQLRLASLPPEARKIYRGRVDPFAKKWYDEGIARRDRKLLEKVIDQALVSSFGDDALLALGDMAFESGDFAAARWLWERIVPCTKNGEAAAHNFSSWPCYPDTDLDLAAVRARLVLASILEEKKAEGKWEKGKGGIEKGDGANVSRARAELAAFARLHSDARGRLGDREGRYVELLTSLLANSAAWPAPTDAPDWPTFAGNPHRNKIAEPLVDIGAVAWRIPLQTAGEAAEGVRGAKSIGENPREPLSFYPVLIGRHVLVNNDRQVSAICRDTGEPLWGKSGVIYQGEADGAAASAIPLGSLGSPRFTMTTFRNRLFARMGSTVTGQPQGTTTTGRSSSLVCLDLAAEGRLLWKTLPEEGWSFEGSPIADEHGVYAAMRRHDIRALAFVACFDADTGRLRWRRFVCGAETPARGVLPELSHNLLTLSGDRLYYNTNLGVVASLQTDDGRIVWLSQYPRVLRGDLNRLASHWRRDLNPCVLDRGALYVAPADSPRIFAFDASTGLPLWQTSDAVEDAAGLLGTAGDWLIAGGGRLYWISLKQEDRGQVRHVWPDGPERPGHGRGLLAGQSVLWPTRDKLYIFDQRTARPLKIVDLAALGASGGNLLVADGQLLIATEKELIALGTSGGKMPPEK